MSGPVPDLLPCPFCGAQDAHFQSEYDDESVFVCAICDARGPMKRSHAEAIAAWNTRSPDLLAMVEKLAEVAEMIANHVRDKNHSFEDDYWACRSIAAEALTEYHAMKGATEQGDL